MGHITERDIRKALKKFINENEITNKNEVKPRCLPENTIQFEELVGDVENYKPYSNGIVKRFNGVNGMVDTLGILTNIRVHKDITDGGEHLAYDMLKNLNNFRNKNYYDSVSGNCNKAMDKIIELYKENEHGTELVKDIEKVLNLQVTEDETTPNPKTKEYLKQCLNLIKGI